jgi:hypothetical protein
MYKKLASIININRFLTFLFILGSIEFGVAAVFSLGIEPDPKNAVLFGYSLSRLALFGLSALIAFGFLLLSLSAIYRARVMSALEAIKQKTPLAAGFVVLLLAGLALIVGLIPSELLGKAGLYFARARLFLFVFCLYPAQFSLYWLRARKWNANPVLLRSFVVSLGILAALSGFILLSGWGITPDYVHWNPAGSPLTSLQLIMIIWIGLLILGLFGSLKARLPVNSGRYFDLLIVLCLFLGAIYFWMNISNPHNDFSTKPVAPYFQAYPSSDAAVHDLGAISILNGSGIWFRSFIDKPLYMVFLAFLHLVGGYDYNLLTILHVSVMALMAPGLYFLGKSFHSRMFGFVLAGIVLTRQYNAIVLTNQLYFNVTPRQFMTEVPTLLGLIIFTWLFFLWLRSPDGNGWRAFVVGGILGAVSLVRSNPFLLIPFVPIFLFFFFKLQKKVWITQSLLFLMGCVLVIAPWVVSTRDANGIPYVLVKFNNIIRTRYKPSSQLPIGKELSASSSRDARNLAPLSAGFDLSSISIQTFPGFVINNTLHNFVGAFFTLPDSIQIDDQNIQMLVSRPYWSEGKESVVLSQIPFLLLNIVLLALGLGWSWKRWKWAGLTPLFVFVVYSLSLGFGRTSGSRYLVPIDWVVNFYYALGLVCIFQILPRAFYLVLGVGQNETDKVNALPGLASKWMLYGGVILVFGLAALIPIAQTMIPANALLCQLDDLKSQVGVIRKQVVQQNFFPVYGEVLYPEIKNEQLSFRLLLCKRSVAYELNGFQGELVAGQRIIAGQKIGSPFPTLTFMALPQSNGIGPQIIWKGP